MLRPKVESIQTKNILLHGNCHGSFLPTQKFYEETQVYRGTKKPQGATLTQDKSIKCLERIHLFPKENQSMGAQKPNRFS